MKELGSKIKELRISLGLSQQQFAESLGYTHKSMINKIELGKCDMSYDKILRLLKEYNLNASEFLDEEEIKINHDKIENLMLPDANRIFPLKSGLKSVIHIKPTIKNKNIIEIIDKCGNLLKELHNKDIIVGDLNLNKIISDENNNYFFIGIDDFGIDSINADVKSPFLIRNFKKITPNKTTDIIMFKKMIAEIILNKNFDYHSYLYFKLIIKMSRKLDLEMKEFLLSDNSYFISKKDVKIKKLIKPC